MKRFNTYISPLKSALQKTPEVFESVGVDAPANVFHGMVNNLVHIFFFKSLIRSQCVRVERRARHDVLFHFGLKDILAAIFNHSGSDFPAPLQDSHDCGLVFSAGSADFLFALVFVHIASLPADKGFVNLNLTAQFLERTILQSQPDAMEHEPCGLLSDVKGAVNLVRTDSVFVVDDHPKCGKPLVESERAVLENGSDLDGEFSPGMMGTALPSAAILVEFNASRTASRADDNPVRPALGNHFAQAVVGVRVKNDCFLKGRRFAHSWVPHKKNHSRNQWTSQVYFCPI